MVGTLIKHRRSPNATEPLDRTSAEASITAAVTTTTVAAREQT